MTNVSTSATTVETHSGACCHGHKHGELATLPLFEQKRMQNQKNNQKAMKKLVVVVLITTFFVGVEVIGGMFANSIAILSDAAHLTSDALGIGISIVALRIGERDSNEMYSYGFHRAEILGALVSILFIWVISIWLIVEATDRLLNPREVDGLTMLEVSVLCLIFNLIQMSILHSKDLHDHAHGPG